MQFRSGNGYSCSCYYRVLVHIGNYVAMLLTHCVETIGKEFGYRIIENCIFNDGELFAMKTLSSVHQKVVVVMRPSEALPANFVVPPKYDAQQLRVCVQFHVHSCLHCSFRTYFHTRIVRCMVHYIRYNIVAMAHATRSHAFAPATHLNWFFCFPFEPLLTYECVRVSHTHTHTLSQAGRTTRNDTTQPT